MDLLDSRKRKSAFAFFTLSALVPRRVGDPFYPRAGILRASNSVHSVRKPPIADSSNILSIPSFHPVHPVENHGMGMAFAPSRPIPAAHPTHDYISHARNAST